MSKVIEINNNNYLINESLRNNRQAQQRLYEKFSPKMLSLCVYYINDRQQAEDIMLQGFFKVFTKLKQYQNTGSFEGWIRKIMVYECISFLRKKNNLVFTDDIEIFQAKVDNEVELSIGVENLQNYINRLPDGSKVVFNMFVIEGYKHAEIAEMLNVTVGTSKTQLNRARKALKEMISSHQKRVL